MSCIHETFFDDETYLKVAKLVGKVSRVETTPDHYRDYYLTSYELVNHNNVHPEQFALLAKDPLFKDQKRYLITVVKENGDGVIQRSLILNEPQMKRLGIRKLSVKTGSKIILRKAFTFETLGQYLAPRLKIYPRVQKVETHENKIGRIERALRSGKANSNWKLRYMSLES